MEIKKNDIYYNSPESVQEYIKSAENVSGSKLIEKLKEFLPLNSKLLEIGSGPGTDWKLLLNDYKVVGSDYSKLFIKHLISNNPAGDFLELNAITLDTNQNFAGIYSNKVLQHLNDEELIASIRRQQELLDPSGIICHSFWKGEGSEIFKGMFVNYHSADSLIRIFEDSFEILLIESYKEFEDEDSLLLIVRKK